MSTPLLLLLLFFAFFVFILITMASFSWYDFNLSSFLSHISRGCFLLPHGSRNPQDSEEHAGTSAEAATNMSPLQPEDDQASCLLLALPLEIKMMVYDYLLISQKPIDCLEHWDGVIVTISVDQHRHPCDVESTILRTCQTIYREALPILYQSNTFVFFDPTCIEQFKNRNLASLGKSIPALDRMRNPYGRLTLIRSVVLHLALSTDSSPHSDLPGRAYIWKHWYENFFTVEKREKPDCLVWHVGFPALERLVLDFSPWRLEASDGLIVGPFLDKLTEFGRLQELTVIGLTQEPTLARLRAGLIKSGGDFNAVTIKEYEDAPEGAKARKAYFKSLRDARGKQAEGVSTC